MSRHRFHHPLSRPLVAATAGACLLLVTACSSGDTKTSQGSTPDAKTADGVTVSTGLLSFDPKTARVKAGQTVTWVGADNITHVLVQGSYDVGSDGLRTEEKDDKTFSLDLKRKGQHVSHTYMTPGTYTYFCTIHRGMNGTVVVS